ncbi:MAG TPA: hypothetical protein PK400_00690 [Phycisphaerales bacterium]|nr:hypothetical protein [Phycisphaerales bacterium]HRQ74533.1 hypothetical protein [Phycisphaerales bacterium]
MKYLGSQLTWLFAPVAMLFAAAMPTLADNTPVGTAFTYQGRLTQAGEPVGGEVNLIFRLFTQSSGGTPLPGGVLIANDFAIGEDGRFTIDLDFGNLFTGEPRWLEIAVNDTTLSPRQPIMPAPHAMVATTAANVPTKALVGLYTGVTGVGTLESLNVSGNVGISTTNPLAQLHIDGSGSTDVGLEISSPGASTGRILFGSPVGAIGMTGFANNGNRRDIRFTETGLEIAMSDSSSPPSATNGLFIHQNGRVGIGNTSPLHPLHVSGVIRSGVVTNTFAEMNGAEGQIEIRRNDTTGPGLTFFSTAFSGSVSRGRIDFRDISGSRALISYSDPILGTAGLQFSGSANVHMKIADNGNVGIGTLDPVRRLHVLSGTSVGVTPHTNSSAVFERSATNYISIISPNANERGILFADPESFVNGGIIYNSTSVQDGFAFRTGGNVNRMVVTSTGRVGIGTNSPQQTLDVIGTTRTTVLQITGGADLSERFDVADLDDLKPLPGMVVSIDPANPGKLVLSTCAYDRTVVGVISGANGVNSGMIMGQEDSAADGAFPVALTGRVYVLADASRAAIEPGDLLTTADRAGFAQPVTDFSRMHGAVIGKAMTGLPLGETGFVLVLVNLQ